MWRDSETQEEVSPEDVARYLDEVYERNRVYVDELVEDIDSSMGLGLDDSIIEFDQMIRKYGKERTYAATFDGLLKPTDFIETDDGPIVETRARHNAIGMIALMAEFARLRRHIERLEFALMTTGIELTPEGDYGAQFKDSE